jgi:hypothetical protein
MAATLTEMQRRSTEAFEAIVVDEIINTDPVLPRVPFESLSGTEMRYLRESTVATPQFYGLDEELPEGTPVTTAVTLSLEQVGLNADTHGLADTMENAMGQRAYKLKQTAKAMLELIGDKVIYGNNTSNDKEPNGIHALTPAAQTTNEGTSSTGDGLNFSNVDATIHKVKNGTPQLFTVTREIHRRIGAFVNFSSTNTPIRTEKNAFGEFVRMYNETPIVWSDRQGQVESISGGTFSAKTGGATSSLFMLMFGMPGSSTPGIFGVQGADGMRPFEIGWLEDKDIWRDRIRWRLAFGLGSTQSIGRVDGITDAAVAA